MKHTFRITFRDGETGTFGATDAQAQVALARITHETHASSVPFVELTRDGHRDRYFVNLADVSLIAYSVEEDQS